MRIETSLDRSGQQREGVIEALASRAGPIAAALKIRDAFDRKR